MDVNLLLLKKGGTFKSIPLPSEVTIIGRRRDCDLRIPIDAVSRRHCRLFTDKKALKIRDLNSRNGTIINGQSVEEAELKPGDKITLGAVTFVMQVDGKPDKLDLMNTGEEQSEGGGSGTELGDDELFADVGDIEPGEEKL